MPILMTSTAYILGANYYLYIPQHLLLLVYITVGHLQTTFLLLVYHVMAYFLHIVTATCALHNYCLIYALYIVTCYLYIMQPFTLGILHNCLLPAQLLVTYSLLLAQLDKTSINPTSSSILLSLLFKTVSNIAKNQEKRREKPELCSFPAIVALLFNY